MSIKCDTRVIDDTNIRFLSVSSKSGGGMLTLFDKKNSYFFYKDDKLVQGEGSTGVGGVPESRVIKATHGPIGISTQGGLVFDEETVSVDRTQIKDLKIFSHFMENDPRLQGKTVRSFQTNREYPVMCFNDGSFIFCRKDRAELEEFIEDSWGLGTPNITTSLEGSMAYFAPGVITDSAGNAVDMVFEWGYFSMAVTFKDSPEVLLINPDKRRFWHNVGSAITDLHHSNHGINVVNEEGELFNISESRFSKPVMRQLFVGNKILTSRVGYGATVAITQKGKVLVFAYNEEAQDSNEERKEVVAEVPLPKSMTKIKDFNVSDVDTNSLSAKLCIALLEKSGVVTVINAEVSFV